MLCVLAISAQSAAYPVARVCLFHRLTAPDGTRLGPSWDGVSCALNLAVNHANERNGSVVPALNRIRRWRINSSSFDTASHPHGSALSYQRAMELGCNMIVGPSRSIVVMSIGTMAAVDGIPVTSYWASSPDLADKSLYGSFSRTYPSDAIVAVRAAQLMRHFQWGTFGILAVDDSYGVGSRWPAQSARHPHATRAATRCAGMGPACRPWLASGLPRPASWRS